MNENFDKTCCNYDVFYLLIIEKMFPNTVFIFW